MSEKSLGERIRKAREERNWSRETLGEKLGVSARTLLRWETKGDFPNYANREALMQQLGLQEEDFQHQPQEQPPEESVASGEGSHTEHTSLQEDSVQHQSQEQLAEESVVPDEVWDIEQMLPPKDDFKLYCGRRVYTRYGKDPLCQALKTEAWKIEGTE